jgi:uncharacterized protein (DUF305 family)
MRTLTQVMTAATAVAALTLAGCGSESEEGATTDSTGSGDASEVSTEYNAADVDFAAGMIPHHAQALEMVEMAADRPLDPEVEELASAIEEAQQPEIETLTTWLETWEEDVPDVDGMSAQEMEDMEGMDGMEGMMSAMSMRQLENAPDEAFQDVWLALMLAHHKGAVAMAETEIAQGENPDAVALAQEIKDGQSAEIETMKSLIGGGA